MNKWTRIILIIVLAATLLFISLGCGSYDLAFEWVKYEHRDDE